MITKENAIKRYSSFVHILKGKWSFMTNTFLDVEGNVIKWMLYRL